MAGYKIKDLEQLTGIKAHTIRMWEKRYGILNPDRSDTQIRCYNDDELTYLLGIALLNKYGLKISRIAEMSHLEIRERINQLKVNNEVDTFHESLILALVELDESLFRDTLTRAIEQHGLEKSFTDILMPYLEKIGIMWIVGSINPAQEHFISNLIRQKVISEIDKLPIPETAENPVMLFLPEHEWHEISLLFYQFIFKKHGKRTVYLGQSLPYDSILECIEKVKPSFLVTSWLTSVDKRFIKSYFKRLWEESGQLTIYAGGYQIKENASEIKNWVVEIDTLDRIRELAAS